MKTRYILECRKFISDCAKEYAVYRYCTKIILNLVFYFTDNEINKNINSTMVKKQVTRKIKIYAKCDIKWHEEWYIILKKGYI